MKIDLNILNSNLNSLIKLKNNYEYVYLNYYNKIKEIENYWNNDAEKAFSNNIEIEKKLMKKLVFSLEDINDFYKNVSNKYSNLGNKIIVDFDFEDKVIYKIDHCIHKIKKIISLYNSIDSDDIYLVEKQKNKLRYILKNLTDYRKKIINTYNTVKKNEDYIKNIVSKINIELFPNSNNFEYPYNSIETTNRDNIIIDKDNLVLINSSLELYIDDEKNIENNINKIYSNMNNSYQNNKSDYLDKIETEIILNLNTIRNIHINNYNVISKRIDIINELDQKMKIIDNNNNNVINIS